MAVLVAYFSAEGTTAKVAKEFAKIIGADVFEIVPQKPYSAADIKWMNPLARCNREQIGSKEVPVAGQVEGFERYDTVYLGFPIWYAAAPRVIYTFCKAYDWANRRKAQTLSERRRLCGRQACAQRGRSGGGLKRRITA